MKTFRILFLILIMLGLSVPATVMAQTPSLQQAQSQGLVGERVDGYIGIVKNAPGVAALVDDINLKRRQLYRDIARKNGIPLDAVERLAAEKAIARAASGEFIQDASGQWVQKP
ncbi:MAG: YdbL family protein [Alphaproteobacteria bacterium]|nr:YdbL family protein [Alphaproteobacteria bacterium]